MDEINLTDVLAECQICAKKGYDIARQQLSKTEKILDKAKVEIQNTLDKFNNSPCYFSDSTDDLQKQLVEIQKSFDKFGTEIKNDVKAKKKKSCRLLYYAFWQNYGRQIYFDGNSDTW